MSPLEVRISECAGFCWGVERALELAAEAADNAPVPVSTLGPLIHNPAVIAELEARGVRVISSPEEATGGTVIIRSHGVPRETKEQLAASGMTVVDATCRFVTAAQVKAERLRKAGYFVIILGEKDHPEVLALRSYAGPDSLVVQSPQDLPESLPASRVGVVVQTTQTQEQLGELARWLAPRCRELLVYNTICNATEQRQSAAVAMAEEVEAVVVVGGRNSANTRRLAELCASRQPRTFHVESAAELDAAWFDGLQVVGVTAGASTPPEQIEAVAERLRGFGA